MLDPKTKLKATIRLVKRKGTVRPCDLAAHDLPADYLDRLRRRGVIERVARGVYAWPDRDITEHHSLAAAAQSVPGGVVCLLSALQFHGLTTQAPHEVWLALPSKAWVPKLDSPKLRILRFSGPALTEFLEAHAIEKVTVRI